MTQYYKTIWRWVFLTCLTCLPAHCQDVQFLPEIDAHLKLNSTFRTYLEAKDDRDGGDPTQFTIGPSLQLYLKPLIRLKKVTSFYLDDAKSRFFVLETGYRYITAPGAPPENRVITAATFNFPLQAGFFVSDRNRADLDWKGGGFTSKFTSARRIHSLSLGSITLMGATALWTILLHAFEGGLWAAAYRLLGALHANKSAVLYSLGALTTYGHAPINLEPRWELMGVLEALDGLILFGLTTAFLFTVMEKAWPSNPGESR